MTEEKKEPTKDEIIANLNEQIEKLKATLKGQIEFNAAMKNTIVKLSMESAGIEIK
jgi:hypothetical protein